MYAPWLSNLDLDLSFVFYLYILPFPRADIYGFFMMTTIVYIYCSGTKLIFGNEDDEMIVIA